MQFGHKIILTGVEPDLNAGSSELANVVVERLGLMPRKKGSTERMHRVLVELYERAKTASREKKPTESIMTVEEMGYFAGITRQTMYEYLHRWLALDIITKTSYIDQGQRVIIGYKLNGNTLESAFEKARARVHNNLDLTLKYVQELQKVLKNEKISAKNKKDDVQKTIVEAAEDQSVDDNSEKVEQQEPEVAQEEITVVQHE